ncbi:MAG: phosphopantetheine-binding protein [Candidatus Heimdallarchaeota archaeon]
MYRRIFQRLLNIISEMKDIRKKDFNLNTYFTKDLGLDKRELAELRLRIEEEFDIKCHKNIFKEFNTVGEIIGFIETERGR